MAHHHYTHPCRACGRAKAPPKGTQLCFGCTQHRHYHPTECPTCQATRPLAWPGPDGIDICADCADQPSPFACTTCGREDHPYSYRTCARCWLRAHLTTILTDPATGTINPELAPLYDTLTSARRPRTTIQWLIKPGSIAADTLQRFARGELPISHDSFRDHLPAGRNYDYLRSLLITTGILTPTPLAIERIRPWLDALLTDQPAHHSEIINRYARWHLLRRLQRHATQGTLTTTLVNTARADILLATRLATWATHQHTTLTDLTQPDLERFLTAHPGQRSPTTKFVTWLNNSHTNTHIKLQYPQRSAPLVTMSDDARWDSVDRLLNDPTITTYSRVAGLFMLLFSWPLNDILRITHDQIDDRTPGRTLITFTTLPIELPPGLSQLVTQQKNSHSLTSYTTPTDTRWLFPGRTPGRHMVSERIRAELVSHGIHPRQSRSAALFSLASQIPPAVLAQITGTHINVATRWATLAARDWTQYTALRTDNPTH